MDTMSCLPFTKGGNSRSALCRLRIFAHPFFARTQKTGQVERIAHYRIGAGICNFCIPIAKKQGGKGKNKTDRGGELSDAFIRCPPVPQSATPLTENAISQGNSNSFSAEKNIAGLLSRQSRQRQGACVGKAFGIVGFPALFSSVLHPFLTSVEREEWCGVCGTGGPERTVK